jgi:hypothetical protein
LGTDRKWSDKGQNDANDLERPFINCSKSVPLETDHDLSEEGAVVKLGGRFFVIAVSTGKFMCDGNEIMGISTQGPIYAGLEGKRPGDAISFNGRELVIEEVA